MSTDKEEKAKPKTTGEEETEEPKAKTEAEENEHHHEEENTAAKFEPVVQLDEVEVPKGTEDEDVVYSQRAKLFIFGETMLDAGTGIKSWKERGVGDMQFLKHRELGLTRCLMRQEKTLKILCNHQLHPDIVLTTNAGSDRGWVWHADDFSDGVTIVPTMFAVRFLDSDLANTFKSEFEKYQALNKLILEGADAPADAGGDAGADDAAAALAGLTTKDDDEGGDKKKEAANGDEKA